MSFGSIRIFNGIQEALVLALMIVSILALFYLDIDIQYKIGITVVVFTIIFLATLATTLLRQQREIKRAQI